VALGMGAAAALAIMTHYKLSSMRRRAARQRWAEAEQRIREQFPMFDKITLQVAASAFTSDRAERLSNGVKKIALILRHTGHELQEAFKDCHLTRNSGHDDYDNTVMDFFVAWREVGEAKISCSAQMLAFVTKLSAAAAELEQKSKRNSDDAKQLQNTLVEEATKLAIAKCSRWFTWFRWGVKTIDSDSGLEQQALNEKRAVVTATLSRLLENSETMQSSGNTAITNALEDVRRAAKPVGEKLGQLRSSCNAGSARPRAPVANSHVDKLLNKITTAEGRQELRKVEEVKAAEAAKENGPSKQSVETPMLAPPTKQLNEGSWRIQGLYEHQALKVGLRRLDVSWEVDSLLEFPRGKDGGALLFRELLFKQLLMGKIRLQSVTGNDIAAAQRDLDSLSLRQLLRLRIQHIDFTPSGCGADTVSAVGGTHEAFLSKLDGLLFRGLGVKAAGEFVSTLDAHKLGREAVLFTAGAASISSPQWWCWWLTEERRTFFHAANFACTAIFPNGESVLEVTDLSKRDRHEPTGSLRWLDWRIDAVAEESKLSPAPMREATADTSQSCSMPSRTSQSSGGDPVVEARIAPVTCATVLQDVRQGLKKTGNRTS